MFCADAIADPLAGLESARAITESLRRGGGELIDVSMAGVAATYAALPVGASAATHRALPPQLPAPPSRPAAALGADGDLVRRLVRERDGR
ncbi:hypothetical protein NJB1907f44_15790 [Mycobacterium marinum]|nr:hypothetical protein NJB1907f34b_40660 [Mycobacterium marinum]GJO19461.1 hypothetical protein NJB1907E90_49930 [Mycobacterium marinum]GJO28063.1 hypothetical protein NJB1907E11_45430 [Mycobacterium marinum]GJO29891.1 hypothetical protein NJB1728e18_44830 [Mycobacterium marinum]GJO37204.1 hypothetical protein NJB1728e24_12280 [Mycobacterium marinum]